MLARRVPPEPPIGAAIGEELAQMLVSRKVAFIGYPSSLDSSGLAADCGDLLWWLADQGVRNFVVPRELNSQLEKLVRQSPHLVVFRHELPPREFDVTALQATAVFLTRPEPTWWRGFHESLANRVTQSVLIAPADVRCPDHPTRIVREVINCPVLDLGELVNRFIA